MTREYLQLHYENAQYCNRSCTKILLSELVIRFRLIDIECINGSIRLIMEYFERDLEGYLKSNLLD